MDRAFSSEYSLDFLYTDLYHFFFLGDKNDKTDRSKFMGNITAARLQESGASDTDELGMRLRCARREPRRFNGLCDTCCWFGHLSCDCLLQRDPLYSDVPTLSSPPKTPASYSGRSGGPDYDIPGYPPQQTPPSYSSRSGGPGYDIPCYLP